MNPLIQARAARAAFGLRALELRRAAGLSQRQLARRARMNRAFIQRIEYGRGNPSVVSIALLAYGLGCEMADLFVPEGQ